MHKASLLILLALLLFSCANKALKYSQDFTQTQYEKKVQDLSYRIYLIGDAGNAPEGKTTHLLTYLKSLLDDESPNSSARWLGDNIYPVGLAEKGSPDYSLGIHRLEKQLECHDNFAGQVYFIPGNHDWYRYGADGIKRQEKKVEDYLFLKRPYHNQNRSSYFLPDSACGKVHAITLQEDLCLILMDSNWYLQDEDSKQECPETSLEFLNQLKEHIRNNSDKKIIVCLHHPPYSFGSHGGRFRMKDYIFPLSQINEKLLIPLPISGLIANKARGMITEQDIMHPAYKRLKDVLEEELSHVDNAIVASGHEHTLQYIQESGIHFIVSGAGSKESAVILGKNADFAAGKRGFVVIDYSSDKIDIQYIIPSLDGQSATLAYLKSIKL